MMTRQEIVNCMKALDIAIPETTSAKLTDRQLELVYFGFANAALKVDHIDDEDFAHSILADYFGMLACPYCHIKLNPESEPEGIEA